jgi:hypothetical protein
MAGKGAPSVIQAGADITCCKILKPAAKYRMTTFTQIHIFMSKGNNKKAKMPSRFKDAVTAKTYTKAASNAKSTKAAADYASSNPKKAFYA